MAPSATVPLPSEMSGRSFSIIILFTAIGLRREVVGEGGWGGGGEKERRKKKKRKEEEEEKKEEEEENEEEEQEEEEHGRENGEGNEWTGYQRVRSG